MTADTFSLYRPFSKIEDQPDGSILVFSPINDETPDDQGEVVDFGGFQKAAIDYMQWANVREMHEHSAVGTMDQLVHDPVRKVSEGVMHIVDPTAVMKVKSGVYKGTSIGGNKRLDTAHMEKVGDKSVRRIMDLNLIEVSLVDRPSRPTARLTLLKRSDPETVEVELAEAVADANEATAELKEAIIEAEKVADPEPTPDTAEMEKAASDDLATVHVAIEIVARLIEQESAEGEADQVKPLQAALASLQEFATAEASELGTPEETAEAAAEEAAEMEPPMDMDMAYAAVIGDLEKAATELAKLGARNSGPDQATIDNIHDLSAKVGAHPAAHPHAGMPGFGEKEAPAADEKAPAEESPTEKLAKVAGLTADDVLAKLSDAPFAKVADLAAMQAALLAPLGELQEQVAKIAAQPVHDGPYVGAAPDPRGRFADQTPASANPQIAAALAKISNPTEREQVGMALATDDISAIYRGR
jgi:hypothetical protein